MRRYLWGIGLVLALLASLANVAPAAAGGAVKFDVLASTAVTGGKTITVTVRLAKAAPAGGQRVALASDADVASVPASLTVPAGRTSGRVSARTAAVARTTTVTLSATVDGTTRTVDVRINPAKLSSLSLPVSLVGGTAGVGTVRRDSASSLPSVVTLASGGPAAVVPATVTIKANESSARFPITTVAGAAATITVTATADGVTKTDTMRVLPSSLTSVVIKAALTAGASTTGKVRLDGPAPAGGVAVALGVPGGSPLTIPASVVIPEGDSAASFSVVAGNPAVKTTVKVSGRLAGVTKTTNVVVYAGAQPVALDRVEVASAALVGGGATEATVTLTRAADKATVVLLSSGDGAALSVPASVTIARGRTSATVAVQSGAVSSATDVAVVATLSGDSKSATVTVLPPTLVALTTDAELTSGGAFTAVLSLDGIAPAGVVVKLESSEPTLVSVPESVEVGEGETSAAFTVTTGSAAEATKFQLVAYYGDAKAGFTGVLLPAPAVGPAAFSPASFTFVPDAETVLTLDLTGPAPADGMVVNLEYSEGLWGEGAYKVEPGARSLSVSVWAKSGVERGTVVAYANDMKAVAEGTVAEATAALTVEREEVRGGDAIVVTVTLGAPAGEAGLGMVIESDNPELVPAVKVWFNPGETTATVKMETRGVKEATPVTLSITDGPAATVVVTIVPER